MPHRHIPSFSFKPAPTIQMPADQYTVIHIYNGSWSGYIPPGGSRESMRASHRIFAGWPVGQKKVVFESLEDLWMPMHKGMVVAVMSEVVASYQQMKDFQAEMLFKAGVTKRVEYVDRAATRTVYGIRPYADGCNT
ncbi:hypothetical protein H0H92_012189, partial [Tricholoma furcatifolium]